MAEARDGGSARPRLTRQKILQHAFKIVSERGTSELSMRVLASSLGAAPMSLYKHFTSREEILTAMVDDICAQRLKQPDAPNDHWALRIRTQAHASLSLSLAYPGIGTYVVVHGLATPNGRLLMERWLSIAAAAGLSDSDALQLFKSVVILNAGLADFRMIGESEPGPEGDQASDAATAILAPQSEADKHALLDWLLDRLTAGIGALQASGPRNTS
jgi:AcrR family transcriptional regulator